jgi:hypothetical protein
MVLTTVLAVAIPEGVRLARSHPRAIPIAYMCLVFSLAGLCAAWGISVNAAPDSWGLALLGDNWTASQPVLPAFSVSIVLGAVGAATLSLLRVQAAARQSLRARLISSTLHPVGATIGAAMGGALGAAAGLAMASVFMTVVWSTLAATALRALGAQRGAPTTQEGVATRATTGAAELLQAANPDPR